MRFGDILPAISLADWRSLVKHFFFGKRQFCIVWNCFIVKTTLIPKKYLYLGYSKWRQIIECPRLEQRFVIEFLVIEKCKLCEIYWRKCDVYGDVCFRNKITNGLNIFFSQRAWKDSSWSWNTFSGKKKRAQVQRPVREVMLTVSWDKKRTVIIDFLEKCTTVNNTSHYRLLCRYFTLPSDPRIYEGHKKTISPTKKEGAIAEHF